jgi:hypothetical protein
MHFAPDPVQRRARIPARQKCHELKTTFAMRNAAVRLVPRSFSVGGNDRPPLSRPVITAEAINELAASPKTLL